MAETVTLTTMPKLIFGGNVANDDSAAPATAPFSLSKIISLASGSGADSINKVYAKRRTLASTTAENLDLSGTLTNPLATTLTFTKVRMIIIYLNVGTGTGPLLIGGHATAALATMFTSADTLNNDQPKIRLRNGASGGLFVLTATDVTGLAVAGGTADMLTIYNEGANPATYDIYIFGE